MPIQVRGVVDHAMSGTELSRVRTEFRLRLPEPINNSPLESRGPTLLCNQVQTREGRFTFATPSVLPQSLRSGLQKSGAPEVF